MPIRESSLDEGTAELAGRSSWWLYGLNFLQATGVGLVFVFLADVQDRYGLADWQLGLIASMGFVSTLLTQLVLAPLVDRGHTAPLAWASVAAGVTGAVGFALGSNAAFLAAARGLSGVGLGLGLVVARKALIGLDVEGGGAKVGTLLSSGVAGFLAGPGIGAALGAVSFETPFIVLAAAVGIIGVPAARVASRTAIAVSPIDYGELGRLVANPKLQLAMIGQFVVFGAIGIVNATVDRYLTDLGASTADVAFALFAVGFPLVVIPRWSGTLAERVGGARVLIPALIAATPTFLVLGLANGVVVFAAIGVVYSTTEAFTAMGSQVLVLEAAGAERVATGTAVTEVVGLTTAAVTAVAAPAAYGQWGPEWLFGGWAAVAGAAALVAALRARTQRRSAFAERSAAGSGGASLRD